MDFLMKSLAQVNSTTERCEVASPLAMTALSLNYLCNILKQQFIATTLYSRGRSARYKHTFFGSVSVSAVF